MGIGAVLGISFCTAAMVADLIATYRRPRPTVFLDPADFLASLRINR